MASRLVSGGLLLVDAEWPAQSGATQFFRQVVLNYVRVKKSSWKQTIHSFVSALNHAWDVTSYLIYCLDFHKLRTLHWNYKPNKPPPRVAFWWGYLIIAIEMKLQHVPNLSLSTLATSLKLSPSTPAQPPPLCPGPWPSCSSSAYQALSLRSSLFGVPTSLTTHWDG